MSVLLKRTTLLDFSVSTFQGEQEQKYIVTYAVTTEHINIHSLK